jgi:hypothetical protein
MDFFQTNGHVENDINKVQAAQHYAQKSQLFWNCGKDCERTYVPIENAGDLTSIDLVGRAAAYADIDNDGDLDVVVTQVARAPKLFINESKSGNWIGLKLLNKHSSWLGAKIKVKTATGEQIIHHSTTKSYLSQVQNDQVIGIGNDKQVEVMISYRGEEYNIDDIKLNQWNNISLE